MCERRIAQLLANFSFDSRSVPDVDLGERNDSALDSEIIQNLQMLFRLRHPTVVSSDDEQREIDRADAGDHVSDEIFVARYIDNRGVDFCAEIQFSEAEVDRDLARFFFGQTIGVRAGERLDERALAVVDVAGGRDNEMFHQSLAVQAERMASTTTSSWCGKIVRRSSLNERLAM